MKVQNKQTDDSSYVIGAAGGIDVVIKAINKYIHYPLLCKQGCSALCDATTTIGKPFNTKDRKIFLDINRVIAGTTGGIDAIIRALNTHINDSDVCENGCGALWNVVLGNSKKKLKP